MKTKSTPIVFKQYLSVTISVFICSSTSMPSLVQISFCLSHFMTVLPFAFCILIEFYLDSYVEQIKQTKTCRSFRNSRPTFRKYVFEVFIQQCVALSLCLSPSICNICRTQCGEMLFEGAYFHAHVFVGFFCDRYIVSS